MRQVILISPSSDFDAWFVADEILPDDHQHPRPSATELKNQKFVPSLPMSLPSNANDCLRLSAIICTHNPKLQLLERAVTALQAQDFPLSEYEFIIIDNGSNHPIPESLVAWHPRGKIMREDELGLTHARLRGIRESLGNLIVFVDDDNVLEPDYLRVAVETAALHPTIGAFAGSAKPEFEVPPPSSILPYIEYLACSEVSRDYWSNFDWKWATPSGAGLCVRRTVAEHYAKIISNDPLRKALGRAGGQLSSGEDHDLALTATDIGLGIGRFHQLRLTHVIARQRLTEDYIVRLYAGIGQCTKVLEAVRPQFTRPKSKLEKLRFIWQMIRGPMFERRIRWNRWRAERKAMHVLKTLAKLESSP